MAQENKSQESRIRALELQVNTLIAAVQHIMTVTKPLIEIAEAAQAQENAKQLPGIHIVRG